MLTVFIGEDGATTKKELNKELTAVLKKNPNSSVLRPADLSSVPAILELASQEALFGDPTVVILDELFSQKDADLLIAAIPEFAKSANPFLAFERKMKKDLRNIIEKAGGKIVEVAPKTSPKQKEEPLPFALSDAVARKDKRAAWMELLRLLRLGLTAEELHGTIFWAVKSMLLAKDYSAADAGKLGLAPGAYQKFARAAMKWEREELRRMMDELVDMYHRAHSGGMPLDICLERLILGMKA